MKIHYTLLLCCLFVAATPPTGFGEGALHTFTMPDGRTLNATILSHNAGDGKIQIKREDEKKLWALPTIFSEADREYIRQWIAAEQFMSPTKFKIDGKKDDNRVSNYKTEITYEITLENKTDFALKDLKIEYRAFILNKNYSGKENFDWTGGGEFHLVEIPIDEKVSQATHPIDLITQSSPCCGKITQDQLKGFWIKVHGPEIDGNPAVREWCNPSNVSEKFAWQDRTSRSPATARVKLSDKEMTLIRKASKYWKSDPEKALEIYHEAYEIAQSPHTANSIGKLHLYRLAPKNIPLGIEWMEKAASNNHFNACASLADIYASHRYPEYHDVKKALEYGLRAISLSPRDSWGHRIMAGVYSENGQFKKAVEEQELSIKLFRDTSRHDRDYYERYRSILESELELYKTDKSKYNRSARTNRRNVASRKLMESEPEKAIELLLEAYEKNQDSRTAKDIGHTYIWYLKPSNIPLGLEWLEKSAKEDNNSACRLLSGFYSTYYGHTGYLDVEKAIKYGRQALSIQPDELPHQTMALAYALDGQFEKAVKHQEQAIEFVRKKYKHRENYQTILGRLETKLELYRNKNTR